MPSQIPIYQQIFLLAHHSDGTRRVHEKALPYALVGGVLCELSITDNIRVQGDRFQIWASAQPPSDPLVLATWNTMLATDGPKVLSHWMRVLAADIHDRVSGGLLAAGLVTRERGKRHERYVHLRTNVDTELLAKIRQATYTATVPDPQTLAMCGFFSILRLEGLFQFNQSAGEILDRLKYMLSLSGPDVQDIIGRTQDLITNSAMSAYG